MTNNSASITYGNGEVLAGDIIPDRLSLEVEELSLDNPLSDILASSNRSKEVISNLLLEKQDLVLPSEVEIYAPEANIDPQMPAALLYAGNPVWGTPFDPDPAPTKIYYAFDFAQGSSMNSAQKFATKQALEAWEAVADIDFIEQIPTPNFDGIDIVFRMADLSSEGPTTAGLASGTTGEQVYVSLDNRGILSTHANPQPGTWGFQVLLHEIGHALGLKHPFEVDSENNATLSSSTDSWQYTTMA